MKYYAQIHSCSGEKYWYRNFINDILVVESLIKNEDTLDTFNITNHSKICGNSNYIVFIKYFNEIQKKKIKQNSLYDNCYKFGISVVDCYIYNEYELRLNKIKKLLNGNNKKN